MDRAPSPIRAMATKEAEYRDGPKEGVEDQTYHKGQNPVFCPVRESPTEQHPSAQETHDDRREKADGDGEYHSQHYLRQSTEADDRGCKATQGDKTEDQC